ncbi:IclR family transcriptional regulator, partial [Streptomyces sp. NPDC001002]
MTVVPIARAAAYSSPPPVAGAATPVSASADSMNSVLGKVRPILEAFTVDDESLSLADLVRRTGVAKATVHRLCQELVVWGLLERAGCDYRLGLRLFEIGQRVHRQRILREVAQPYMEDLLLATQETIHFAIHDGLDVVYLEKILPHRGLSEQSRVAGRLPLYCTATGKAIL